MTPHLPQVYVLDDDADCRDLLQSMFEVFGLNAIGGPSVADMRNEASEVLACRLIVLDVNLGAGQPPGTAAYEWLRERHFGGRVVFLTGHARSHPLVQAALASAVRVMEKPVTAQELERLADEVAAA
jgi:DNA-binding NtrC family response regulator